VGKNQKSSPCSVVTGTDNGLRTADRNSRSSSRLAIPVAAASASASEVTKLSCAARSRLTIAGLLSVLVTAGRGARV